MTRSWTRALALLIAMALWLPALSFGFDPAGREQRAQALAKSWSRGVADAEVVALRAGNPEWDLMRRMFAVLALADRAIAGDERALANIDRIVAQTLSDVRAHGSGHFLLPYADARPWRYEQGRSLFVDGEMAMMLAARQMAASDDKYRQALSHYAARIAQQIDAGPIRCGESYPDECWTFCNTTALAALRIADAALESDHAPLAARWLASAREHLVDRDSGLLASSYSYDGAIGDGPEGSSLWMSVHNLRLIDQSFARDQYRRASDALATEIMGFGFAREWPGAGASLGPMDIDSGPVIPLLGASAGSSGLALLAAASFGDDGYFDALSRSLDLAAFPIEDDGGLRYAAAGPMGDAVIFAAHTAGPLWDEVLRRLKERS